MSFWTWFAILFVLAVSVYASSQRNVRRNNKGATSIVEARLFVCSVLRIEPSDRVRQVVGNIVDVCLFHSVSVITNGALSGTGSD